ncbi:MAG: hypothetical protein KAI03_02875, partial [Candidatus Aureabacteria bacterium]|nr:hypothetical protein [Candidatus Auribacterota bacterium]
TMNFLRKIKKNKSITSLRRYIVYVISVFFLFTVKHLPWKLVVCLGRSLGKFAFHIVKYTRKRTLDNLTKVFGQEKTDREIFQIAKNVYKNIGITALEFPKMSSMTDKEFFSTVDYEKKQIDFLWSLLDKKKGVIFASAHMGNWEMLAGFGARLGFKMSVLYKPSTNPYLNKIWFGLRGKNQLIDITENLQVVTKRLRANEVMCILFDENARKRGVKLNFLGRPASTYKGPAYFSLRTGCPIVCLYFIRGEDGKHKFIIERTIYPKRSKDLEKDIIKIMNEMNASLELMIKRYPDQWNWIYKRWET